MRECCRTMPTEHSHSNGAVTLTKMITTFLLVLVSWLVMRCRKFGVCKHRHAMALHITTTTTYVNEAKYLIDCLFHHISSITPCSIFPITFRNRCHPLKAIHLFLLYLKFLSINSDTINQVIQLLCLLLCI